MGTSGAKLNRPTSYMEFEHEGTFGNLKTHSCPAIEKVEAQYVSNKILSPSSSSNSSSPDSPLNDLLAMTMMIYSLQELYLHLNTKVANLHFLKILFPKLNHHREPSNYAELNMESTREAPPTQVMEHATSSYRIPSSVFARSKSTAHMEWSVASDESLFSIHTGNMSFAKDHFFWRSGELGAPRETSTSVDTRS